MTTDFYAVLDTMFNHLPEQEAMYHGVCLHDTQLCCRRTVHASRLREKKVWWLLVLEK